MKHFKEAWDILVTGKKKRAVKESQNAKNRINDLFIKCYSYQDKIEIPFPSLWSIAKIDEYFGSQDKIDFNNMEHIGKLLYILTNQYNDEPLVKTKDQLDKKIREILETIPANLKESYQQALWEMFAAFKKNSIHRTRDMLQQLLATIQMG